MEDLMIPFAGHSVNFTRFIESIPHPLWLVDQQCRLLYGNDRFRSLIKDSSGADLSVGGAAILDRLPKPVRGEWKGYYDRAFRGESFGAEVDLSSGGKPLYLDCRFYPLPSEDGAILGALVFAANITKRMLAEKAFQEEADRFRAFFEHNPDAIYSMDREGKFLTINRRGVEISGYSVEEFLGMDFTRIMAPYDLQRTVDHFQKALAGERQDYEVDCLKRDGTPFHIRTTNFPMIMEGRIVGVYGIAQDISKTIALQNELDQTWRKLKLITDNTSDLISLTDRQWNFRYATPSHKTVLGYAPDFLIGKCAFDFLHPADRALVESIVSNASNLTGEHRLSAQCRHADGHYVWLEVSASPIFDENGKTVGAIFSSKDATDRKHAEQALRESEEKYRSIFENAVEGIFQSDPEGRLLAANPAVTKLLGYASPEAMIASVQNVGKQLYLHEVDRIALVERLQEGDGQTRQEVLWRRQDQSVIWVSLGVHAVWDEQGNIRYFEGTVEDIARRKEMEAKLKQTTERLHQTIGVMLQVVIATVDGRDPYTAAHQRRVSDLSRAIATEMGLSADHIEAVRLSGSIHDIGKIRTPAEILVKPTKLLAIEYSLLKEHVVHGYEILKEVMSPWPLADIVLQHHERLDGSGYPRGLKGEEIRLEARILAVADVVESMTSYRPYRLSLGLDAAVEEIETNKGVLYDASVVDACVRLFREKGYRLPAE